MDLKYARLYQDFFFFLEIYIEKKQQNCADVSSTFAPSALSRSTSQARSRRDRGLSSLAQTFTSFGNRRKGSPHVRTHQTCMRFGQVLFQGQCLHRLGHVMSCHATSCISMQQYVMRVWGNCSSAAHAVHECPLFYFGFGFHALHA